MEGKVALLTDVTIFPVIDAIFVMIVIDDTMINSRTQERY